MFARSFGWSPLVALLVGLVVSSPSSGASRAAE